MTFVAQPLFTRSELVDASFLFARRHSLAVLRAALPVMVPAVIVDAGTELLSSDALISVAILPVSLMAWGLAEGTAIAACWDVLHGIAPTASRSWAKVAPRIWAVAVGYALKWLFIMAGLLLLVVPGFYLIGRWFAVPTASIAEGATLPGAFRRSSALTRSDLNRVLWTLGLVELGLMIFSLFIGALLSESLLNWSTVAQTLAYWVIGIAILPFRAGLTALLYLDIRMRREAYDLQTALRTLSGDAA